MLDKKSKYGYRELALEAIDNLIEDATELRCTVHRNHMDEDGEPTIELWEIELVLAKAHWAAAQTLKYKEIPW